MKKSTIGFIAAVFITVGAIASSTVIHQGEVRAATSAVANQGWSKDFIQPVKIGDLFVTNDQGKQVTATITLGNEGKTAHVNGIEAGSYTLHVKPRVVSGKRHGAHAFKFTVEEVLTPVSSAKELIAYFEQAKAMQQPRLGIMTDMVTEESAMADSTSNKSSGSSDYSTTNNQVEGVDEADIVKTDGDFIYAVVGDGKVSITDIRNPKNIEQAAAIKMEEGFYPSQLFLHGKTLVVLGEKYEPYREEQQATSSKRLMPVNSMTMVRLYDVSNPKNPSMIREIGAEGYLNGARKAGDMLYFITNVRPYFWIMDTFDGDILRPSMYDSKRSADAQLLDYRDIAILPGAVEPSYSVITAINLSSPATNKVVTKGYLGSSEQLYMSEDNLYLTATAYDDVPTSNSSTSDMIMWNPGTANTELFKFALKGTDVKFHSSTELKGQLLNQFSMDEHKGYFRVVMTEGNTWDDKNPSKNHLFILDENMKLTGSVEGLAKGERIYSARFMGDKAYMVTFRETDPLFVIDVAKPAAPKVLGELKIPGFSNYLHPLDDTHLIGFGYETVAEKNPNGGEPRILTKGMKISLFNISDFANPKEQDTEIIGGRGTYSPIQYDHKALFQHKNRNLYGFPVMVYDEIGKKDYIELQSSGALVYEITSEKGIVLKGDLLTKNTQGEQYSDWDKQIQRMLYSKDELYTISMKEINSYSLDTFGTLGGVKFD
ncbi:beta-propeller domain-containing protein [Sporosarcina sp. YIM B06819]|uniref:beta-propeller domain-containing protein n=1 Tax=Sporosarcina sp. YIM B06819 TaxID=3081769 RepID=UPI00298D097D|nr:beta-propeller domain-containing protein [Sporosarcina sp. YIM B06819]